MKNIIIPICILIIAYSCNDQTDKSSAKEVAKKIEYHYQKDSDPKAVALAKEVIEASGGWDSWESTNYIAWTFFNSRRLLWDKAHKRARIKSLRNDYEAIVNLTDTTGVVYKDGALMTNPDSLQKYLDRAYKIWINDSYWLVLPFKLLDKGVRLNYVQQDTTQSGMLSDVIQLTFDNVGVTPGNKYHIWISKESKLIGQWSYYTNAEDEEPRFVSPWDEYVKYEQIYLSSHRGEGRSLDDIKVFDEYADSAFTSLSKFDF